MENIKKIFGEEYVSGLKNINENFDFDGMASKGPLSDGVGIVFDTKDLSQIKAIAIGEAPGAEETVNLTPFFGYAGKNLRENLENENEIYITNSIKFRPIEKTEKGYKNRTPSKTETKFSSSFLKQELEYLESIGINNILLIGNKALETMLFIAEAFESEIALNGEDITIKEIKKIKTSDLINSWITFKIDGKTYNTFIIFHTSPLNYNKKDKKESIKLGIKEFLNKIK